jgi:hypothetical protein
MVFEDLNPGDETRRNGDYVALPHPDGDDTALDSVTIPRGRAVTYDGTALAEPAGDNSELVAGVLANYNVYGDSGSEEVGPEATVKMRGEVIADLTAYENGAATVEEGGALGANGGIYIVEEINGGSNLYRVQVR